jgi:thioredoxin reductase (NADPH)
MNELIIIGSGPAGVSASLYAVRAGIKTTVISKGYGALGKAELIENYYGVGESISGQELHDREIERAKALGVNFISDEIVGLSYFDRFIVSGVDGEYSSDAVILATGSERRAPKIKGISEFENRGVSYCAICDAFACRGRAAVVIGSGEYALHEAIILSRTSSSVTVLTNGAPLSISKESLDNAGIGLIEAPISEIFGESRVNRVIFDDETHIDTDMVFIAIGVAGTAELARKAGAYVENGKIITDEKMSAGIPGLYAAGDCTGGLLQIAKAVHEGAQAGLSAVAFLKK